MTTPIVLTGPSRWPHTLAVVGKNPEGDWQSTDSPTTGTWTIVAVSISSTDLMLLGN